MEYGTGQYDREFQAQWDGDKKPRVVHCKKESYDVYIGRPSKWGNPFIIGKDGTRDDVIEMFRESVSNAHEMIKRELRGKTLGCWCAPKPCHGDVLLEIANDD